jgi:flagellar biosynthesis/type III secretory pathway M-ring protein FliF/YscJ
MNVRLVVNGMLPAPRKTLEERRERNRKNVKAFRQRNPERWAEIQRNWRANRSKQKSHE